MTALIRALGRILFVARAIPASIAINLGALIMAITFPFTGPGWWTPLPLILTGYGINRTIHRQRALGYQPWKP